jgi:hypothetical protein
MQSFKKLLDTVRSKHPDLISEEAANNMLTQFDTSISQMKADALAEGQQLGFKEGYDEGKKVAADEAKKSMDELLEKLDTEKTAQLKSVIDMLNEDHAAKLQEVYDSLMSSMVPISEMEAMDEDHAEKFAEVLAAKENEYTDKLNFATESVREKLQKKLDLREEFHEKKLKAVKLALESKLDETNKLLVEEKERKLEILAESVEKYINYALQKSIPTKQLISEQKYLASRKAIEKITSILKIDNILQESKDGVFQDYERKLAESKETSNKLLIENSELKNKLDEKEAKLLLESKLTKCTPSEAAFLRTYFENAKSSKIIEEGIEDARSVYKRLHEEKRQKTIAKKCEELTSKPTAVVSESKTTHQKEPINEKQSKVVVESKQECIEEKQTLSVTGMSKFNSVYSEMLTNKK